MTQISYPKPPFPDQQQDRQPGLTAPLDPQPDHGEKSYKGSGRLAGKVALITGGDSGIGRAVAIAYAREGADVAISYLDEDEDAQETARWVEEAGRRSLLLPGDITDRAHCRELVAKTVDMFGRIDVIVNNAAYGLFGGGEEVSDEQIRHQLDTNLLGSIQVIRAALPHLRAQREDASCRCRPKAGRSPTRASTCTTRPSGASKAMSNR